MRVEAAEWRGVAVRYPFEAREAVGPVSLALGRGERVLLLGPSGCGKSSLLLALTGLIPEAIPAEVSGGRVIGGIDAGTRPPAGWAERVGFLFQNPERNLCGMRVAEEVAFALEQRGMAEAEIGRRVARALAASGLPEDFAARKVAALSGGEKQRVELAALMAQEAGILLLDEPTAHLDGAAAASVRRLIAGLGPERAALIVDHRLDGMVGLMDRVVVLGAGGRVACEGPPRPLFREEGARLEALGIWRPAVSEIDAELVAAGIGLAPAPLTMAELLEGCEGLGGAERARAAEIVGDWAASRRRHYGAAGPVLVRLERADCAAPDGRIVLRGLTLELRAGEVLALIGPNGAGKTTLGLALAGYLPPVAGRREGPAGAVALQNPDLQFVAGTVAEEVGGRPGGCSGPEVGGILARAGLQGLEGRHPLALSEGQKRRLALAAIEAARPWPFIVLDEPTAALDAAGAAALTEHIAAMAATGRAVVLITHDMELAWRLADRVAIVARGGIARIGAAEAVLGDEGFLEAEGLAPPLAVTAGAWAAREAALHPC
ncbi:MAG TPA: ATP-binding cassette domain-containing protein [Paracoccaceae bacterium]|nr:ATP-binding cassette domain-containing protein [Paracoccaceae bacterium]